MIHSKSKCLWLHTSRIHLVRFRLWDTAEYTSIGYVIEGNRNSLFHALEAMRFEKPFMALKVWHWHFVFSGSFTKWFTNELTQFPHHCLQWLFTINFALNFSDIDSLVCLACSYSIWWLTLYLQIHNNMYISWFVT